MYERSHYYVEVKSGNQPTLAERSCWMVSCWPTSKVVEVRVDIDNRNQETPNPTFTIKLMPDEHFVG